MFTNCHFPCSPPDVKSIHAWLYYCNKQMLGLLTRSFSLSSTEEIPRFLAWHVRPAIICSLSLSGLLSISPEPITPNLPKRITEFPTFGLLPRCSLCRTHPVRCPTVCVGNAYLPFNIQLKCYFLYEMLPDPFHLQASSCRLGILPM